MRLPANEVLVLVVSALVIDVLALMAIAGRISEFGFSANKVAALGENLILLVNLAWAAWLYSRFLRRRGPFAALERWQTGRAMVRARFGVEGGRCLSSVAAGRLCDRLRMLVRAR